MNAQHTQGRMVVNPIQLDQIATADASQEIARASTHRLPPEVTIANARRLAACWNACDGLSTESLERGDPLAQQLVDALNRADLAEGRRDELLEVLQEAELVLAEKLRRLGADPTVSPMYHRIRAAIAKETGDAA